MTQAQALLLKKIRAKKSLLSRDEMFDFYTDHVMRSDATCKFNSWKDQGKGKWEDYDLWELEQKALHWYKLNLGSLIFQGFLKVEA